MNLRGLLEKSADMDVLCEMIVVAGERLTQLEVGAQSGAAYGEKSGECLNLSSSFIINDRSRESIQSRITSHGTP